jgi:hypothetical protein
MVSRHEDKKNVSPSNASLREKKLLQIRGDLQGLLCNEDWSAVDAMLRGVKYADSDFLNMLILWKNKWQQSEPTLLHDVLVLPASDPPIALLKMLINAAPQVLLVEDATGNLPLHAAIYSTNTKKSLEIIRFLVQADSNRASLTPITLWQSIRRGDEPVVRFLLKYPSCAKALVIPVNGKVPLYYASKNSGTDGISPLLRLLLEATCDLKKKRWCCLYAAIYYCSQYLYDAPAILELARKEKLYCTNHLVDVAGEKNKQSKKEPEKDKNVQGDETKQSEKQPEKDKNVQGDETKQSEKQPEKNVEGDHDKQSKDKHDVPGEQSGQSSKQQADDVPAENDKQLHDNEVISAKAEDREATTSSPNGVVEE